MTGIGKSKEPRHTEFCVFFNCLLLSYLEALGLRGNEIIVVFSHCECSCCLLTASFLAGYLNQGSKDGGTREGGRDKSGRVSIYIYMQRIPDRGRREEIQI